MDLKYGQKPSGFLGLVSVMKMVQKVTFVRWPYLAIYIF